MVIFDLSFGCEVFLVYHMKLLNTFKFFWLKAPLFAFLLKSTLVNKIYSLSIE